MAYAVANRSITEAAWSAFPAAPNSPYIRSISGDYSDDNILVIKGLGFGSPPENIYVERYSGFTAAGQSIADISNVFDNGREGVAVSVSDSRSGSYAVEMVSDNGVDFVSAGTGVITYPSTTEVFISYAMKNPTGKVVLGNTLPNAFDEVLNNMKNAEIGQESNGQPARSQYHYLTPLALGTTPQWGIDGNDTPLFNITNIPDFWTFGEWNRLTTYMKADPVDPSAPSGTIVFQGMSESAGQFIARTDTFPIFSRTSEPPLASLTWNYFMQAPYFRPVPIGEQRGIDSSILYDDLYLATGDNASARFEIGNNATYENCTQLSICDHRLNFWGDDSVAINLRQSEVNLANPVYMFVFGADDTLITSMRIL